MIPVLPTVAFGYYKNKSGFRSLRMEQFNVRNHRTQMTFATDRSLDFVPVHWDGYAAIAIDWKQSKTSFATDICT
jgi:hypothetical protein